MNRSHEDKEEDDIQRRSDGYGPTPAKARPLAPNEKPNNPDKNPPKGYPLDKPQTR